MKLTSIIALTLALLPVASAADPVQNSSTTVGNGAYTGSFTASNLNPQFLTVQGGQTLEFNVSLPQSQFANVIQTNLSLQGALVNPGVMTTGNAFDQIYGFSLECIPYNSTLLGTTGYPYTAESNGISGGTITIDEYKLTGAAVVVGTIVLPNSPHGGPYVSTATSVLPTAYTPTFGSIFGAYVTATAYGSPYDTAYEYCNVTLVLQNPNTKGANG